MRIGLLTDSTCDLPKKVLDKLEVYRIPLKVRIEEEIFYDWQDLNPEDLYRRMREGNVRVTTHPPDVQDFVDIYQQMLKIHDEVISVHLSSALSRSLLHARLAAKQLGAEDRIHCFDSQLATVPQADMVMLMARAIFNGANVLEVLEQAKHLRENTMVFGCPNDLDWLLRGGKLNPTRAFVGNVLSRVPVIYMRHGSLDMGQLIARQNVCQFMIEQLERHYQQEPIHLGLGLAGYDKATFKRFKVAVDRSCLQVVRGRMQLIGAAIGAHLGPGTVMVTAYPKKCLSELPAVAATRAARVPVGR